MSVDFLFQYSALELFWLLVPILIGIAVVETLAIYFFKLKGKNDFKEWVQERGLYFPKSWSNKFEPHIEFYDYDKIITKGGLLTASYGNGKIIYTGISFSSALLDLLKRSPSSYFQLLQLFSEKYFI